MPLTQRFFHFIEPVWFFQDFARLGSVGCSHDTVGFHKVNKVGGASVANAEASLQQGSGSFAELDDQPHGIMVKLVVFAFAIGGVATGGAGKSFALEEEYIAGWLSFFPATHLTPYVGIHSVRPSSSVLIRAGKHTVSKYWDFDPKKRICYRSDGEYEEHYRGIFAEAVRRRLRSDSPVLAELSGGMDSSSIVCIADSIAARGASETPRLDTVSYYNDSEPNWNERPYFAKVEKKRGRVGCHIDIGNHESFTLELARSEFHATPGAGATRPSEWTDARLAEEGINDVGEFDRIFVVRFY